MDSSGFKSGSPLNKVAPFLMAFFALLLAVFIIWMLARTNCFSDEKK
jgi:uncharacterized membrane protein YjgN (DUF898 family)